MRVVILVTAAFLSLVGCNSRRAATKPAQSSPPSTEASDATNYPTGGSEKLYAAKWFFTEVNSKPVNSDGADTAHLQFYPGQVNRVTGSTGCNRLNGTFELAIGNAIKFSPIATTKRLCPGGNQQEQDVLAALQSATHFYVVADTLLLLNNNAIVARLQPQKSTATQNEQTPSDDDQLRNINAELLRGLDFKASGTEPFWSLDIDRRKEMRFRLVGDDSIITPAVHPVRLQDVAASSYRAQTEKGLLNVVVYDKFCVNSMSGHTLPKTVQVTWNGKKYEGCGSYLSDYRLADIWIIRSINDTAVDGKKLQRGAPQLEINLSKEEVTGHTGCNGFGGRVEVTGRFITFSRLNGTMMACDDGGFETRYYKLLAEKEMPYEVDNGFLTIHSGTQTLRYQKGD